MSPSSYTRSLLKVSVGQILQTVGFQTVQASALDILVEILERYIYLLGKTSHDYAELANRTEPCLDDLARAFDKHKVGIFDLEEYIKYVDTPEFELRKHLSKHVTDADKNDRFIPEDVRKRTKLKQKQKSYADYLGYCCDANNKELLERLSDEENEYIYDYMPLMTLDKQKIQEAETILNESAQNMAEESAKDQFLSHHSMFVVKNGQRFKNTTWKSVYEPKFLFKPKENIQNESNDTVVEPKDRVPTAPSAMLPRYAHKPKSKYKRLIYLNAVNFCNKSISSSNAPTEITELFESKKIDTDQSNIEVACNENDQDAKEINIEEGDEKVKQLIKPVSIVDQMLESLVTKYTTPAKQPVSTQSTTVKNNPKETVKETKQVLNLNSSLALNLDEHPISYENAVPRLKLSIKTEIETIDQSESISNFDENAMDGLEKSSESILWKPVCTNENFSDKNDKEKIVDNVENNKPESSSSSKHKKKKKNKDKNKSKDKDKEKKHKKKSEKDKSDDESSKKKEDKKLKKLLKKQKKKMEKAAAMANTAISGPDSSVVAFSFTSTVETSQVLIDHVETKQEIEPKNKIQQSPQDLSIKSKKTSGHVNQSTSTPIMGQKTPNNSKPNEPKLPKLKLKLNSNESNGKANTSLSQHIMEPVNFSTPQQTQNQRHVSQSAQRVNSQQKRNRPVNINQSMPAIDIELGEVVQQKSVQKNQPTLTKQKSQLSNSGAKVQANDQVKASSAKSHHHQQSKNVTQQPKKDVQKVRPSTSNNSSQSINQFSQIHQEQILFQEALAQEVQNALAQEALAREAILQEAYNNPQLLPIILPFLQAQNQVINPQFDLSALIAQASLQTLTTSQILEAQQLTQQQMAAQYATSNTNPNKKRKTMDMESKSQNTSLNRSQNKPKSSQSLDQSMKRNNVSQQEYVDQDFVNFQHDESGLNPIDENNEYKWHQMRVKQEEESLLEQVQALNMSRLTPAKKNNIFNPNVNSTPDVKKKNANANDQDKKNSAMKIIGQIVQETEVASNQHWSCPICNMSDESAPMIACDSCDDWYHWPCVGLTEEPPEYQNWYCHKCGTRTELKNDFEIDVESYETADAANAQPNSLLQAQSNAPSDYLSNLKIKKKKK